MRRFLGPRLTYSNVMATVAVFLALGGGAYAITLERNAVKTRNIAPRAVKAGKIAPRAVKAGKIAPDAVGGAQVKEGSLGQVPDADLLDGLDSSAFALAGQGFGGVFTGRAVTNTASAEPIFDNPPMNIAVETDGVIDPADSIVVRAIDGGTFGLFSDGGASVEFGSAEIVEASGYADEQGVVDALVSGGPVGARMYIRCLFASPTVTCFGFVNQP